MEDYTQMPARIQGQTSPPYAGLSKHLWFYLANFVIQFAQTTQSGPWPRLSSVRQYSWSRTHCKPAKYKNWHAVVFVYNLLFFSHWNKLVSGLFWPISLLNCKAQRFRLFFHLSQSKSVLSCNPQWSRWQMYFGVLYDYLGMLQTIFICYRKHTKKEI